MGRDIGHDIGELYWSSATADAALRKGTRRRTQSPRCSPNSRATDTVSDVSSHTVSDASSLRGPHHSTNNGSDGNPIDFNSDAGPHHSTNTGSDGNSDAGSHSGACSGGNPIDFNPDAGAHLRAHLRAQLRALPAGVH